MSSFREETIIDLFGEQLQGMALFTTQLAFEALVEAGCSPEASLLELYMSEEVADDWRNCARIGLWKQLGGHSTTSQYGQLTRGASSAGEQTRQLFSEVMDDIQSGAFASEWMREQDDGLGSFERLREQSLGHPINKAEEDLLGILKRRP
jgi:ketol-acid reductoisomerase